jgi:hypothetical protein
MIYYDTLTPVFLDYEYIQKTYYYAFSSVVGGYMTLHHLILLISHILETMTQIIKLVSFSFRLM